MRTLHRLRMLRRSRNLNPLAVLSFVQKAGQVAKAADDLRYAPGSLKQIGEAAQRINDAQLVERLGNTAQQVNETARWVKYAALGGVGLAAIAVARRAFSGNQPT